MESATKNDIISREDALLELGINEDDLKDIEVEFE